MASDGDGAGLRPHLRKPLRARTESSSAPAGSHTVGKACNSDQACGRALCWHDDRLGRHVRCTRSRPRRAFPVVDDVARGDRADTPRPGDRSNAHPLTPSWPTTSAKYGMPSWTRTMSPSLMPVVRDSLRDGRRPRRAASNGLERQIGVPPRRPASARNRPPALRFTRLAEGEKFELSVRQ